MTLPDATKERVIMKWLIGMPRAQIVKEEGISDASIDNIINEFFGNFGRASTKAKIFFTAMRRSNLSFKHHAVATRLLHILIRYVNVQKADDSGPSVGQLEKAIDLFEEWCNACDSSLTDPAAVIDMTKQIEALCSEMEVLPQDLQDTVARLVDEARKLREEVHVLTKEKEDALIAAKMARDEMDEELRKNDVVFENLEAYKHTREIGAKEGVNIDDYMVPMSQFIDDLMAGHISPGFAFRRLKEWSTMQSEFEQWKAERLRQFEFNRYLETLDRIQMWTRKSQLAFLERLHELGISEANIARLDNIIRSLANRMHTTPEQVFEWFLTSLEQACQETREPETIPTKATKEEPTPVSTTATAKPTMAATIEPATVANTGNDDSKEMKCEVTKIRDSIVSEPSDTHSTLVRAEPSEPEPGTSLASGTVIATGKEIVRGSGYFSNIIS